MSDHEQFAHITQSKWAIMSESLRLLTKNEQMNESLVFLANRSFAHFWAKTSDSLGKSMSEFPALTFLDSAVHSVADPDQKYPVLKRF